MPIRETGAKEPVLNIVRPCSCLNCFSVRPISLETQCKACATKWLNDLHAMVTPSESTSSHEPGRSFRVSDESRDTPIMAASSSLSVSLQRPVAHHMRCWEAGQRNFRFRVTVRGPRQVAEATDFNRTIEWPLCLKRTSNLSTGSKRLPAATSPRFLSR
jgi:hypothetical protein